MSHPWQTIELRTLRRVEVRDITDQVTDLCRASDAPDGLLVVTTEHTTTGLCVNEAEPGLLQDLQAWLDRTVPVAESFAHNRVDDNADAHLRAILLGHSVCVPVVHGTPGLGRWQRILFVELDGPRTRRVRVNVIGG